MTERSKLLGRAIVLMATAGATLLALSGPAAASGTGQHDVTRVEDAKTIVSDLIEFTTKGPAEATTSVMSIAPGGHTAWHHHPGPHIVKVKAGTLRVYETDCTFKTYTAGQGFYDPGRTDHPHIHTGYNAEATGDVVIATTDIREADKRLAIVTEPQPAACFTSAANGVGALGVTRTDDAKVTIADPMELKTKGAAEAVAGHITIGPGGHTAWHHHPGPHIVLIKAGTLRVYKTDCTFKTFSAGQGFYDPGRTDHPHIHTGYNAEATGDAVLAITDIREEDKRLAIATNPEPAACFGAAAATGPGSGSDATGSANLPRTGAALPPGLIATLGLSLVGAGAVIRAFGRRRLS
jgi:quercetin dioxygenase-like cupin family protein